ncbi:PREDICTED: titin-like [Nicrophorus vespilloides]|uniref:Titin-like n=1 Tax=Nicrophorus vespilloides TaxID=110193 RepID=A0ABM1MKM7_NICVS|nr:PREDICTED: titin-like [Nicrophorus vespilloides]
MDQNPIAKALVSFEATDEVDLSYKAGDVVKVIKLSPGIEWWKVELNGKTGMVHKDSFELYKYMVVVDYLQPQEGYLQLNTGDLIDIVGVQKYKWIGRNQHGEEGSVDTNYVKQLPPFPKKTDTLDRIIPHEILVDLRKGRPRKASRSVISPRAHTVDIVEVTEEFDEIPVEPAEDKVEMRPKTQRPTLPWMQELSDKNKTSSLFSNHVLLDQKTTPKIRTRELPKNFSKIKDMWNQSDTQVTTSTSTVRSSFNNGILRKSIRVDSIESQEHPGNAKTIQRSSLTTTLIQNDMNESPIVQETQTKMYREIKPPVQTKGRVNANLIVDPVKTENQPKMYREMEPSIQTKDRTNVMRIRVTNEQIPVQPTQTIVQEKQTNMSPFGDPWRNRLTYLLPTKTIAQPEKAAPIVVTVQPDKSLENAPPLPTRKSIPKLIPHVPKITAKEEEEPVPKLPESEPPKLTKQCAIPIHKEAPKDDAKQIATLNTMVRELQEENMEMRRRMSALEKRLEFLIEKVLS